MCDQVREWCLGSRLNFDALEVESVPIFIAQNLSRKSQNKCQYQ